MSDHINRKLTPTALNSARRIGDDDDDFQAAYKATPSPAGKSQKHGPMIITPRGSAYGGNHQRKLTSQSNASSSAAWFEDPTNDEAIALQQQKQVNQLRKHGHTMSAEVDKDSFQQNQNEDG